MNWIKDKLRWVKQNVWIPLSATVVLLLSILLLRKPKRELLSTIIQNNELIEQESEVVNQVNEETQKEVQQVKNKVKNDIKKIKVERKKKMLKIDNNKRVLLDELSKHTNKELVEMLKKDDEV